MTKYNCEPCKFESNKKSNYKDHLQTKKHKEYFPSITKQDNTKTDPKTDPFSDQKTDPITGTYICIICGQKFTKETNMYRHRRNICEKSKVSKLEYELQIKVKKLEEELIQKELERLRNEVDNLKRDKDDLKRDKDNLKKDKEDLTFMNKSSLSSLNYVIANYPKAPIFDDVPRLTLEHMMGNYTIPEYLDKILYSYKKNYLAKFLGEQIVDYYKRDDPTEQSIHASDTIRLCFLIMQLDAKDKTPRWAYDKKGDKFNMNIIKPLLASIKEELNLYLINNQERLIEITVEDIGLHVEKLNHAAKILVMIDDKVLENDILKYIAPGLYLKK